ncbi:MAG: helix-turn-helix transcriptional regulator [Spirochaetia bacterium]
MNSAEIGRFIRLLRNRENMSQEKLGELLNLSYQQVQKYELGQSKITIELLSKVSHIFLLSISEIIELSSREFAQETPASSGSGTGYGADALQEQDIIREFRRLKSPHSRELILRHIKGISKLEKELSDSSTPFNHTAPYSGGSDSTEPYSPQ